MKFALRCPGNGGTELADHHAEHRIAQKFQLLVVAGGVAAVARFAGQGTVGQRAVQQFRIGEPVASVLTSRIAGSARIVGRNYFLAAALVAFLMLRSPACLDLRVDLGIASTLSHHCDRLVVLAGDCRPTPGAPCTPVRAANWFPRRS